MDPSWPELIVYYRPIKEWDKAAGPRCFTEAGLDAFNFEYLSLLYEGKQCSADQILKAWVNYCKISKQPQGCAILTTLCESALEWGRWWNE
jgi:3'-phosphoadenosine 5'-phosphosulfate (PAPS) 3'-phosphatase